MESVLVAALLVLLRVSAFFAFAPVLQSLALPVRWKAAFAIAVSALVAPLAAAMPGARVTLSFEGVLGEVLIGLAFGLALSLLTEAILFSASLMSMSFSFSLANLLDPNSQVETQVLGTALNWLGMLVLLTAGLHRTMIAAVLRSITTVPLGTAVLSATAAHSLLAMMSGVFLAGLQLAAPVMSASLLVEVAVGLIGRMAPALPAQVLGIPLKTIISYGVLIGSLSLWPRWIEHHFTALLEAAQRVVCR